MSRRLSIILIIVGAIVLLSWGFLVYRGDVEIPFTDKQTPTTIEEKERAATTTIETVADNLEVPWGVAFLPDGDILVTERPGTVLRISPNGTKTQLRYDSLIAEAEVSIPSVSHVGEGGLLGIALHPDFVENNLVYLYSTVRAEAGDHYLNRVEQYELVENELRKNGRTTALLTGLPIPGARYHDGGRIAFGPDGKLYITVGDATNEDAAQEINSADSLTTFAGTILRLNPDGSVPEDNPFADATQEAKRYVYSYGHRNPQGLTWDTQNRLWSTEHGRSGVLTGFDELNLITAGSNYGWPNSQGDEVAEGTVSPVIHSGPRTTWAPASAAYLPAPEGHDGIGRVFFGGLRGEALYEAVLNGHHVIELRVHFKGEFGRIRTVALGPDGLLYLTTSNRDGRGDSHKGDDKLLRIDPFEL